MEIRPSLPDHLERVLGRIERGWAEAGTKSRVQVVSFKNQPEPGITTFATLGLGKHQLRQSSGIPLEQELLISADSSRDPEVSASVLFSLSDYAINSGKALVRGQVIQPNVPIIPGSALTGLFITNPSPLPSGLIQYESDPPTVFAYVIPITTQEAILIAERGWQWFEERLEQLNPNIWDFSRTGISRDA